MVFFFVMEIQRHNQSLGFLGVWKLLYLGISERRRNLRSEIESINLLRYRFMWENFWGEKKDKWWQYIRMLGSTLSCIILTSGSSATFILFWVKKVKNGELVEKVESSKMVTSLDKTEEVMGHGVGDAVTSQEVLWSDKWWGWGVFQSFLSLSSMSISLLLGVWVLWHCFGRWVYVFLVLLVLVLCWNKLGAFIAFTISSWSGLIGTVSLLITYWFIWTLRFWFVDVSQVFGIPKIGYGRSGQMGSLVSSNRRLPYQALVEFGMGVQQRVIRHKGFSGFGYGAQKCVIGNMILLWRRNWDNEIITYYASVYKESRLMVFMCWCNILFHMMRIRSFIICLNYNCLLILFLRDRGITEVKWCWGFRDGLMRWVESRNLVLPRDHANILFQHEMRKCFEELNKFDGFNMAKCLFHMGFGEFRVSLHPILAAQKSFSIYFFK